MKVSALLTTGLLVVGSTASVIQQAAHHAVADAIRRGYLEQRASPEAPDGYAPAKVSCPSTRPTIRNATALSSEETTWLEKRRNNTVTPLKELLTRLNITDFDAETYITNNQNNASALPNIGIAFSGGGYRALMNGAGALAAFDSRTPNSTNSGHIGGLLQSATYIAGLSGGSWLVGSIYVNNFTSVQAIMDTKSSESSLWQFANSILEGPDTGGIQILSTAEYWKNLYSTVDAKVNAGFDTSLTDYWSRALSFQLVNATDGGPSYTWSSIADDTDFSNATAPMPIIVADGRAPGETIISINTTNFEINPWEFGSFDLSVHAFAPLKYVGSTFSEGKIFSNESCYRGFDNAAFVMGTSSTLFNQFLLNLNSTDVPSVLKTAIQDILEDLSESDNDISSWTPNPFYYFNNATDPGAHSRSLTLVDGGEDLQNIPLHPLLEARRAVDVVFAVDSSADTVITEAANWPNGTALVATYERAVSSNLDNANTTFPAVPDQNTFVNLGLNSRPTFFGCNASNTSSVTPLIVYIPNSPYVYYSNVSTYTLSYTNSERNAIIENGYDVATMGNGTVDANWPACVGCAIMSRAWDRAGATVPSVCQTCFDTYCWNGTVNSTTPDPPYVPTTILGELNSTSAGVLTAPTNPFALGVAAVVGAMLMI